MSELPKDGYYIAVVQCDSGGEAAMHVKVLNGVPQTVRGDALVQSACSQFMEVSASEFCRAWPREAAMELDALRTANAGLVEKVRTLTKAGDMMLHRIKGGTLEWTQAKGRP